MKGGADMLLDTMTYEEICHEAIADSKHMITWASHRMGELRRISLKARSFPVSRTMTHITPNKNKWTLIFVVLRKIKHNNDCYNALFTSFHAKEGNIYIQMTPNRHGDMCVSAFIPHFFHRYAERLGLKIEGEALAQQFFRFNDAGYFVEQPDGERTCLCTPQGICLGEYINDRMFLARTFIRYDMSLGCQREAFNKMRERFNRQIDVLIAPHDYDERFCIKEIYKRRDRAQSVVFHH